MSSFGELLRRSRRENGLTQEEVARRMGASKSYVSGIESGKVRPPSPRLIRKLTTLFRWDEREMLRLACVEKAPRLIREELRSLMFPPAGGADPEAPVAAVRLLNTIETGYSARLAADGRPEPAVDLTLVVPRTCGAPCCAITVCDDSMEAAAGPSFSRGDIVLLAPADQVQDGRIGFLIHETSRGLSAAFRRTWLKQDSRVLLEPLNGRHAGATVPRAAIRSVCLATGKLQIFGSRRA